MMDCINIVFIIDFVYDEEMVFYIVFFYLLKNGEIIKEFEVGLDEDGLIEEGVDKIIKEVFVFMEGGDFVFNLEFIEEKDFDKEDEEEFDVKVFCEKVIVD